MTAKGDASRSKTLAYVVNFEKEYQRTPTYREIADGLGWQISHIFKMVEQLANLNYIVCYRGISRGIRILPEGYHQVRRFTVKSHSYVDRETVDVAHINFRGYIAAGAPISSLPYADPDESIMVLLSQIPQNVKVEDCFALKVQGDSMIDDGIFDGDIVILRQTETASNGDTVAVWLDDYECTTLKRYHASNGRVLLIPRNRSMQPIEVKRPDRMRVQGRLVCVLSQ
jgi:repressor LexA